MPTLEINGRDVEVDDSFLSLSAADQEKTVDEIAAHLSAAPPAPTAPVAPPKPESGGIANSVDAFGRGAVDMATLGFADELGAGARWLGGKLLPWRSNVTYDEALQEVRGSDDALAKEHPVANAAGQVAGAVGLASGMAKAGVSPVARSIQSGGGLGKLSAASAVESGILGAAQGAASSDGDAVDRIENAGYGLVGGTVLGGALPSVTAGLAATGKRMISPFLASPERSAAAAALAKEGIETTAGQATGSKALRYAEGELGGQRAEDFFERQGEQFTKAALSRTGTNADRATPDVIDDAFNRIGGEFGGLAQRNTLIADGRLAQDLGAAWKQYESLVPKSQRAPIVMDMINDIGGVLKNGTLDGSAYQAARSRLDKAARSSRMDPQLQEALFGIRNSLDDAMERSIRANNPADLGAWQQVRDQYKNLLVIEKAASGAGENTALGLISPSQLRNATVQQNRRDFVRGKGGFAALARNGESIMKPLPNSGTAPRLNAQNLGIGLAGLIGAGAGTATGDPTNAAIGAAAGFMAPKVAGAALMSPVVQALLRNQAASNLTMSPVVRALLGTSSNVEGSEFAPSVGRTLIGR
ncbi:MAG: hypothetical protein PGN22_02600 [Agrobacterium cavarae]